jgi:hypothetical protein
VRHRYVATGGKLCDAADIARRDEIRSGTGDIGKFAIEQGCGDLWLQ